MSAILETPLRPFLPAASTEARARPATIDSTRLMANAKLIHIEHRGELYSLRETRLGKLILTK